jgi:hypothetical protein
MGHWHALRAAGRTIIREQQRTADIGHWRVSALSAHAVNDAAGTMGIPVG